MANPFLEDENTEVVNVAPEPRYKDAGVQCTILPGSEKEMEKVPRSAASEASFSSALENVSSDDEGPETPRAAMSKQADPEYIHLPWEHNSKVYEDWFRICELIDSRVMKGKRVLVHCQLGVSRSASLIVAYGLYKNPRLTPDEAREQAKRQSRFIDLNMHFMYELGDFKKLLAEKYPASQVQKRPGGHMGLSRTMTDSVLATRQQTQDRPMSPIVDEAEEDTEADSTSPHKTQFAIASNVDSMNAGPSSAPVGMAWSPTEPSKDYGEESGRPSFSSQSSTDEPMDVDVSDISSLSESIDKPVFTLKLPTKGSRIGDPTEFVSPAPLQATNLPESNVVHAGNEAKDTGSLPPPNLDFSKASKTSIQNSAQGRDSLPPPNFSLPSGTPRHSLRPMPSLPAGFHSNLPKRSLQSQVPLSSGLSLNVPSLNFAAHQSDAEPDIMSPRAAEFMANPFHQTIAGDLAESTPAGELRSPQVPELDPRSPPTRGEAPIIRNIDDILG